MVKKETRDGFELAALAGQAKEEILTDMRLVMSDKTHELTTRGNLVTRNSGQSPLEVTEFRAIFPDKLYDNLHFFLIRTDPPFDFEAGDMSYNQRINHTKRFRTTLYANIRKHFLERSLPVGSAVVRPVANELIGRYIQERDARKLPPEASK